MGEKLLPCPTPWCDDEEKYVWQGPDDRFHIICGCCQVQGPDADDEPSAIAAWNTRAPAEQTGWQPIETAPRQGFIVGGFFTEAGRRYTQPVVLVCRERDHPSRVEFYAGKQRMFPTHFLTFSPDLTPATTRAPADLRSALEAETIERAAREAHASVMKGGLGLQHAQRVAASVRALAPTKGDAS